MRDELPPFQTHSNTFGEPAGIRAFWRFRVKTLIADAPGAYTLVKARPYNGIAEGAKDYIVKLNGPRVVGEEFYATKPEGGTGAKYGTPQKNVVWQEVSGAGISVFHGKLKTLWSTGQATVELYPCKSYNDGTRLQDGAGVDLPAITVNIEYPIGSPAMALKAAVNDILGYVEIGKDIAGNPVYKLFDPPRLPASNDVFQVIVNAAAGAGNTNWKAGYVQAHN